MWGVRRTRSITRQRKGFMKVRLTCVALVSWRCCWALRAQCFRLSCTSRQTATRGNTWRKQCSPVTINTKICIFREFINKKLNWHVLSIHTLDETSLSDAYPYINFLINHCIAFNMKELRCPVWHGASLWGQVLNKTKRNPEQCSKRKRITIASKMI